VRLAFWDAQQRAAAAGKTRTLSCRCRKYAENLLGGGYVKAFGSKERLKMLRLAYYNTHFPKSRNPTGNPRKMRFSVRKFPVRGFLEEFGSKQMFKKTVSQ